MTFKNIGSKLPLLQTSRFIDFLSTEKCFSVLKSFRSHVSCKLIWHVSPCIAFSTCISSCHSEKISQESVFVNLPAIWNAILKSKIVCCKCLNLFKCSWIFRQAWVPKSKQKPLSLPNFFQFLLVFFCFFFLFIWFFFSRHKIFRGFYWKTT